MNSNGVLSQINELTRRLILASLCVKHFHPTVKKLKQDQLAIGMRVAQTIALKDLTYDNVYEEINGNEAYHLKLIDGGLMAFQYLFDSSGQLVEHRLAFFPCPSLPSADDAPALYQEDELYADITSRRIVRFPIRFDYSPGSHRDVVHPASHMTLGQYDSCRIPVSGPVSPSSFGMFIIRNFYARAYTRNKNTFDRRTASMARVETITGAERRVTHVVHGL